MHQRKLNLIFAMTAARDIPGGIPTLNLNILYALLDLAAERDVELTILDYLEKTTARPDFLPEWVTFRALRGNRRAFSVNLLRFGLKQPIYCFDHVTLALPVLPLAAARLVKTVIFAHGSEAWRQVRRTSRWSFQCASLCLTNSDYTLRKMCQRISSFNGVACPLGLSPEFPLNGEIPESASLPIEFQAADGKRRKLSSRVLLLVGRMDPAERRKGHYPLLNVLPAVLREYPDVQLVFPGPGDDRGNLKQLAERIGVASSVFLPGYVSKQTLQQLYQHCYAYVMPSKQEGFGLTYLEAMNYGKPCVGCFDDGAEDVIVHGETGLLVRDPNDPRQLLEVLRVLLDDSGQAQRMGRNGFKRLHERFTSRHVQARIKEQIGRVL